MYLELYDDLLWFHTDVRKWTAEIKHKYKGELCKLLDLVNMPLLAFIGKDNKKLAKFAKSIGFSEKEKVMRDNQEIGYIYGLGY